MKFHGHVNELILACFTPHLKPLIPCTVHTCLLVLVTFCWTWSYTTTCLVATSYFVSFGRDTFDPMDEVIE
jgi:hypothetical protein